MPQWNLPGVEPAIGPSAESEKNFWHKDSLSTLQRQLLLDKLNKNIAKNVILFIGDGMSIPTIMVSFTPFPFRFGFGIKTELFVSYVT